MRTTAKFLVVLGVVHAMAAAQDGPAAKIGRLTRRLAEVEAHQAELRDLAARHATGEDLGEVRWLTVTDVDRTRAAAAGAEAAAASQARSDALAADLAELHTEVTAARQRAEARALGDTLPRPEELARLARAARGETELVAETAAPPAVAPTGRVDAGMAPPQERSVIHGTADRGRVGGVLLEAGIALLREAEQFELEGRTEAAEATRLRARQRLEAACAELEPAARNADTPLATLFTLARCEEKLGRIAVADALYAAIVERDRVLGSAGRAVVLGPFGRSARTARTVMGWLRDTSDWRPRRDVDSIRWDDR